MDLCWQSNLLFNMLPRLIITFLPRSKCLLISWLQSPSAVILEPKKIKSLTVSIVSPSICHEVRGPDAMILVFWMLSFKPTFSLSSLLSSRGSFSSLLSAIRVASSAYLRLLIFLPSCRLKRRTTWELRVKFHLGQNEDCSPGGSTSDSSGDCSKEVVGEGQYIGFWWRGGVQYH